jgi:hypothetical protein
VHSLLDANFPPTLHNDILEAVGIELEMVENAEGSTLRLTLGCLLSERLGITLYRVGSGKRMTFCEGEDVLSNWMDDNAFVSWIVTPEPWITEAELIASEILPLHIDQNTGSPSLETVRNARREAKEIARCLPVRP